MVKIGQIPSGIGYDDLGMEYVSNWHYVISYMLRFVKQPRQNLECMTSVLSVRLTLDGIADENYEILQNVTLMTKPIITRYYKKNVAFEITQWRHTGVVIIQITGNSIVYLPLFPG